MPRFEGVDASGALVREGPPSYRDSQRAYSREHAACIYI